MDRVLSSSAMISVHFAASGEEAARLDLEECQEVEVLGNTVRALKRVLAKKLGVPRFRQHLFCQERGELNDKVSLSPPEELQLVILSFWPSEEKADQKFIAACRENRAEELEAMLRRDEDGRPALHIAAEEGHVQCMSLLLEALAGVHAEKDKPTLAGATPLHLAALNGHLEAVRTLLEAQCHTDARTSGGKTPLHGEIVRLLLEAGAEDLPAEDGLTALELAQKNGHWDVAQMLAERH
ncbi:Ankyrin-3 (ANK-3) (Ankyrin-G) [Durusdinium trenchii]|uniref:Ankyrin-3 (ANK-3) (Ankyrin-G) n=1 Tax=Durusdinium trenchii TaxID=1381693 RepID=A0ABP0PP34_9DINO